MEMGFRVVFLPFRALLLKCILSKIYNDGRLICNGGHIMKRILSAVLCCLLLISFSGCKKKSERPVALTILMESNADLREEDFKLLLFLYSLRYCICSSSSKRCSYLLLGTAHTA